MRPGRNDSCPCGSGRKYKRCCLALDNGSSAAEEFEAPRFFGYVEEGSERLDHPPLSAADPVCMVFQATEDDIDEFRRIGRPDLRPGDWCVSTGAHENTVVHGPFSTLEEAFEFGRRGEGVTRYISEPGFHFL